MIGSGGIAPGRDGAALPAPVLLARAERELRRHAEGSRGALALCLPLDAPAEGRGLLALAPAGFAWWSRNTRDSTRGATVDVAVGAAAVLRAEGRSRFAKLRRSACALWPGVSVVAVPGAPPVRPRLFGGLAFHAGAASDELWQPFGDARFVLPRIWWHFEDGRGVLVLALARAELARRRHTGVLDELERALALLASAPRGHEDLDAPGIAPARSAAAAAEEREFRARVAAIGEAIRRGEATKVVAARRLELRLDHELDVCEVSARLTRLAAGGCSFAMRQDATLFFGATPERLVSRCGRSVASEALAGSRAADGPEAAELLLASAKDRSEHQLVVDHVVRRLRPRCSHLEWPEIPRVRLAGRVLHLKTPVRGQLRTDTHVLDLAAALHPTPAVGGVPAAAAARWVAQEPHARGWYASPVGWFDDRGDGDFAVALRSALATDRRVCLWAGAGVVAGSDPDAELHETELKLGAMLDTLHQATRHQPSQYEATLHRATRQVGPATRARARSGAA